MRFEKKQKIINNMKKIILTLTIAIISILPQVQAQNQSYSWGLGARIGADYGFTVKRYLGSYALDFMGIVHDDGFQISGLYEWQTNVINPDFTLYYGCGASTGVWNNSKDKSDLGLAFDGVVGLEWKLPNDLPFTLSLDWKPSFELIPDSRFYVKGFALSFKYVF